MQNEPAFVGEQTIVDRNDPAASLFFMCRRTSTDVAIRRVVLSTAQEFNSIEDILSNVKLIPLEKKNYSITELSRHIMHDALVPIPNVFSDYGIIAHAGHSFMDRPICVVHYENETKYYAHPEIEKLVRRIDYRQTEATL